MAGFPEGWLGRRAGLVGQPAPGPVPGLGPQCAWGRGAEIGGATWSGDLGDGPAAVCVCGGALVLAAALVSSLRGSTWVPKEGPRPEPHLEAPQLPLCFLAVYPQLTAGGPAPWGVADQEGSACDPWAGAEVGETTGCREVPPRELEGLATTPVGGVSLAYVVLGAEAPTAAPLPLRPLSSP